ncbi:MAG: 2-oxoacid:acceptor oxidoreductase family protein, partial [Planctomycetes bacterium]|nr:2-oxoacid:acceptor oxidoreductase family protein [Planctomycetota bacterium]
MTTTNIESKVPIQKIDEAVIRFAGDSGDGMQLTGSEFTSNAALFGNDLATFPDFPAEIRAPAGTLPGVSAFQVRFSSQDVFTPGSQPDVLVAMNPAALKVHLPDLKKGGILIANTAAFEKRLSLQQAGWETNPLEDEAILQGYRVIQVDLNKLTRDTLEDSPLDARARMRCKNFAALGVCFWIYSRDMTSTINGINAKFGKKNPDVAAANIAVLNAGYNYAETVELLDHHLQVEKAKLPPGKYRNIMGNQAVALGLIAAAKLAKLDLFYGTYPITPASDILHHLARHKSEGVITFQAEDEIAAVASAIGASFGGALGVTASSGPGIALKGEALGLAVMTELPLV